MEEIKRLRQDRMGLGERLRALLAGNPIDRVPLFPLHVLGFSAINVGYSLASIYNDPIKSFWAQVWTQEQYGYEFMPIYNFSAYGAWEFGGELKFPSSEWDQAPSVLRYPIESEEDLDKIERIGLPDVKTRGSIPLNMEFSKLQANFNLPIVFLCGTPFTRASNVCGLERLSRWTIKKPELAHRVIRLVTRHLLEVAQYWVDTFGAEGLMPYSGNPIESNNVISPKQFERFCIPYTKELHEKIFGMGIKRLQFHMCGDQNLNLAFFVEVPMGDRSIVSFGHEVDITTAIKYLGDTCIIVGNVEPVVLQMGTPQQVYELSRRCIEKGKYAPKGFMLAQGCELPPKMAPYNIYAMRKAINDFGWYDDYSQ